MDNESLETIEENWENITLDSQENVISFGDGTIITIDNPLPVQVVDPSASATESTEEIYQYPQDAEADPQVQLLSVRSNDASPVRTSGSDFRNVWKLSISGSEYNILFPENSALIVIDGKLYNTGSGNITGMVLDNSFSDTTYSNYTFTILPLTSSNTQNTVYRYGSRQYLTAYSVGTASQLQTSVQYVQADVVSRPYGFRLTPADWLICGLLLFSVLVSILGGLIRR